MASARVLLFLLSAVILLTWVQRISGTDSTSILDMLGKSHLRQNWEWTDFKMYHVVHVINFCVI